MVNIGRPGIFVYRRTDDYTADDNIAFIRRANGYGYNALVAHDGRHQHPQPDSPTKDEWARIQSVLDDLGWVFILQSCSTSNLAADNGMPMSGGGPGDQQILLADGFNPDGTPNQNSKVFAWWRDCLKRALDWHPKAAGIQTTYDEIRRFRKDGWLGTPGELLAMHLTRCAALIREVNPAWLVCPWDDMFNPFVNAVRDYTGGGAPHIDWSGAEKAITPDMVIQQWCTAVGPPEEAQIGSAKFYGDLGCKQVLAVFYDFERNDYGDGMSPEDTFDWIEKAIELAPGSICGIRYDSYQESEDFSRIRDYVPPASLIAKMAPFPAASTVPPQPPFPPPVPPSPPNPLASTRASLLAAQASARTLAGYLPGIRSQEKRRAATDASKNLDGKLSDALNSLPKP